MKKEILKEEVDQIIKQSFWGIGGVRLTENTEADAAPVETEEQVETEEVNEETHSCPLCESALENPISDEKLTEHIEMMLGIINEMNDITDEELEAIEEEIDEVDDEDDDVEVVEEAKKKMPAFLKKGKKYGDKPMAKA
jgi:hypothetical protein